MSDSFLERRLSELSAGEQSVPLAYDDLREQAHETLQQTSYDYATAVAGSGDTAWANRTAFRRYRIVTRVLRGVTDPTIGVELLDQTAAAPVVLAPIGGQSRYHDEGELATARAAGTLGVPMTLSTSASHSIEAVADVADAGPQFFQLSLVVHSIDNGGSKSPVSHRSDVENEAKNSTNAAEEPANIGSHTYPFRGCH